MPRILEPVVWDEARDWSGGVLPRGMTKYLTPGCIVRVVIQNNDRATGEAIYFKITKVKDGTFWGTAQDTYRLFDTVGMREGEEMTFRREQINEIPLNWQPKSFQKAVAPLTIRKKPFVNPVAGLRGA
ncbi:MAG: hypothetical protein M1825_002023 [Sarcosagium campestre]|nr:MAG: hypothetical protein M1825_002023 [Sarcosagium campestre]